MTTSVYNIPFIGFCPENKAFSVRHLYHVAPLLGTPANQNPDTGRLIERRNAHDLVQAIRACNRLMDLMSYRLEGQKPRLSELRDIAARMEIAVIENEILIADWLLSNPRVCIYESEDIGMSFWVPSEID